LGALLLEPASRFGIMMYVAVIFWRDLRYALRTLRASSGYTLMCIGVLALGIGANAAIFSVIDSVILSALPYPDPSSLVFIWERFPGLPAPVGERMKVARKNYLEWKRQGAVFAAMEAFRGMRLEETGGDRPQRIRAAFASAGLFPMLGAQARLGRLFTAGEDRPGADAVAVLSATYFERRFHGDPNALGRTLSLGGVAYRVIGVLPPKFHVPSTYEGQDQVSADVWMPLTRLWDKLEDDRERALNVAARLKPGTTLAAARAEMAGIATRLQKSEGEFDEGWQTAVFPFSVEDSNPGVHRALYVLMGAVVFLLLIACANLANLQMARMALRSREMAVRLALGATRAQLAAQVATEAMVLSLAGAALGLLLARWAVSLMVALKPEDIQRPELISVSLPVFAFAGAATVLTTLLFGLIPSLGDSRADLGATLKSGGWGASAVRVRSRQFLIAVEVALALMLVTGAGLMIRSFREIVATGVGFDTSRITSADIDLPAKSYADGPSQSRFFRSLIERAQSIPGVSGAAVTDTLPLHSVSFHNFSIAGRPEPALDALPIADQSNVSPGYFNAIGLRLETGRWFTDRDLEAAHTGHAVVAVNRAFVRKFFPNENPLGKILRDNSNQSSEIVAVVSDYRALGVEEGNRPTMFHVNLQMPRATLLVRGGAPPQTLAGALRNAVWSLDRSLPAVEASPMESYVDELLSQRRFNTLLLEIFAGLALALGMIGIYGVLSNLVASRVREIGIRMAIGASPAAIGKLMLRQCLLPVAVGLSVGLAGSLALGRFLEALLFQVHARDPLTLALASCTILVISPLAIWLPLRRATRVDCTVALRAE
jgi:putative ABC transport system permease protein